MTDNNSTRVLSEAGWNDPPHFSYDSQKHIAQKSSLNKRVKYPADAPPNTQVLNIYKSKGPPPVSSTSHIPLPHTSDIKTTLDTVDLDLVIKTFQQTLEEVYNEENEKEVCEIKRRLSSMEKMWKDSNLPEVVKQGLGSIIEALQRNDFLTCDKLQRSLMVDYTSSCSSWMAAVRMLINSKRAFCEKQ